MTTLELVNAALATVQDPELHRALPELGMVKSVTINGDVAELENLAHHLRLPNARSIDARY